MSFLELRGISRSYASDAGRNDVLHDINLDVEEGEFIAIVDFSGSGKATLLSIMAGLIQADAGTALLRGRRITQPGPDRGVVFQSYSLLPWLSVTDNVALGVDQVFAHEGRDERMARVRHYIDMVGLSHAAERKPAELSGGMRQRVAVARALATSPDILLLDEPLSALDALTRARLQDEIERIWAAERKTVVLITNDVDEAILLADRIIPLTPGPRATLGPEFKVALPRPRDRTTMNDDPQFKALRAAVTRYLLDIGHARPASNADSKSLPNLKPITLADQPPKAYQDAARSSVTRGYVEFSEVRKQFATPRGPLTVVDGFNLKMPHGEFISLIGHSGCGKSTVLSMMAGLADVSYSGIILDGREVHSAGPDRAVVFQAPSLMPWLTARKRSARGRARLSARQTQRARGHRQLLLESCWPRRCDAQAEPRSVERHAPARRYRARLCAIAEITVAGRTLRHARQPDAVGTARSIDGGLA